MSSIREILYEDNDVCVECDYLDNRSSIVLHLKEIKSPWSPSLFKRFNQILNELIEDFKKKGYVEIYAIPTKGDDRAKKLISLFGFDVLYVAKNDLTVMKKQIK